MTLKTDQCSICLDSPPYSECPGRQCQRLAVALKAKEEAAAALEMAHGDALIRLKRYHELLSRAERAEKALEEAQRDAARYRFWRKLWCADDDLEAMNSLSPHGFDTEDEWDAILDAAIKGDA